MDFRKVHGADLFVGCSGNRNLLRIRFRIDAQQISDRFPDKFQKFCVTFQFTFGQSIY